MWNIIHYRIGKIVHIFAGLWSVSFEFASYNFFICFLVIYLFEFIDVECNLFVDAYLLVFLLPILVIVCFVFRVVKKSLLFLLCS